MKINKNSWHYKINRNVCNANKNVPGSLCPYVRGLLFRMLALAVCATLVGALCHLVGQGIMVSFPQYFTWLSQSPLILNSFTFVFGMVSVVSIGATTVGVLVGVVMAFIAIEESRKTEDFIESIKKSDNIAIKYVIAKHNKYCPQIEFED